MASMADGYCMYKYGTIHVNIPVPYTMKEGPNTMKSKSMFQNEKHTGKSMHKLIRLNFLIYNKFVTDYQNDNVLIYNEDDLLLPLTKKIKVNR